MAELGIARTVRALPTLLRVGVAETIAYRAEFIVWILTTTQPFIMLSLMTFVTRTRSFGGYTQEDFVAYYLANLIVRQLTSNWVAWQMMEEIRNGTLAMRLLRPVHPFFTLLTSQLAAVPFRSVVALPIAVILLVSSGAHALPHTWWQLAVIPATIVLAWLVSFAMMFALGSVAFFLTNAFGLGDVYFGMYSLFSGYLLPLDLLPHWIARTGEFLPFKCMMFIPLQIITRDQTPLSCLHYLGVQLAWLVGSLAFALTLWRRGMRRFESVGA